MLGRSFFQLVVKLTDIWRFLRYISTLKLEMSGLLELDRQAVVHIIGGVVWRIRLEAQDIALSRRRHGFESRIRYQDVDSPGEVVPGAFLW